MIAEARIKPKIKRRISEYLIGSDIEVFLKEKESGKIVTAEGIIKGTKKEPYQFDPSNKFFATSLDCVSAEFGLEPAKTAGQFYLNVQKALRYIEEMLPDNLQMEISACARLDEDQLQSVTANTFGCESSLNCWSMQEVRPEPTGDNLRVNGTHLHVGYNNPNIETNIDIIKAMEVFVGIPSILIEPENERRLSGYGCAGNWRQQKWGAEYRVLSGYFASSQELIEWCFKNTEKAIEFVNSGRIEEICNFGEEIQMIINENNKELAQEWVDRFQIEMP